MMKPSLRKLRSTEGHRNRKCVNGSMDQGPSTPKPRPLKGIYHPGFKSIVFPLNLAIFTFRNSLNYHKAFDFLIHFDVSPSQSHGLQSALKYRTWSTKPFGPCVALEFCDSIVLAK